MRVQKLKAESCPLPPWAAQLSGELSQGQYLVRSEAALLLLLLLDSESELLRGRLQSLRYTRKLFFTGWFPLLKPLAGRSEKQPNKEHYHCTRACHVLTVGPQLPSCTHPW